MDVKKGDLFFIKDEYFNEIDTNFKADKEDTKRPHFFGIEDKKNDNIIWAVPISSKVEKFEKIVEKKISQGRPHDGIQFGRVLGEKRAFLFQDMFPLTKEYIKEPYVVDGKTVKVVNKQELENLEKTASKVSSLLEKGIKLMPNSPDIKKIKDFLQAKTSVIKVEEKKSLDDLLKNADKILKESPKTIDNEITKKNDLEK